MTTHSLGRFFQILGQNRVGIALCESRLQLLGSYELTLALDVLRQQVGWHHLWQQAELLGRILGCEALGSHYLIHAAVRAWSHHAMLYEDGLALSGLDECRSLVAILEIGHLLASGLLDVGWAIHSLGIHRHKRLELVAAMNVEHLADRAKAVRRIHIATMQAVEIHAPVVPVLPPVRVEVVQVSTLHV